MVARGVRVGKVGLGRVAQIWGRGLAEKTHERGLRRDARIEAVWGLHTGGA